MSDRRQRAAVWLRDVGHRIYEAGRLLSYTFDSLSGIVAGCGCNDNLADYCNPGAAGVSPETECSCPCHRSTSAS